MICFVVALACFAVLIMLVRQTRQMRRRSVDHGGGGHGGSIDANVSGPETGFHGDGGDFGGGGASGSWGGDGGSSDGGGGDGGGGD